jgi:hypothetical protein
MRVSISINLIFRGSSQEIFNKAPKNDWAKKFPPTVKVLTSTSKIMRQLRCHCYLS